MYVANALCQNYDTNEQVYSYTAAIVYYCSAAGEKPVR